MRQQGSRRPRLVIGPGILMAVLVTAIIAFRYLPERRQEHGPPKILHTRVGKALQPTLTVAGLLKEQARLRFSQDQFARLRALEIDWQRKTDADRQALGQEEQRLERWLASVQRLGKPVAQGELQQRQQEYSRLSAKVAYWRRLYWGMALDQLTPEQRRQAENLARRAMSPRVKEEQRR